MKINKFLIGQRRDLGRIPAGLILIGRIRKQDFPRVPVQNALGRGKGALHFIVHHSVDGERAFRIRKLIVPSLLHENLWLPVNRRMEHAVQVYIHKILKILVIAAGHRVYGFVRIRHGVQKGIERPLYQLHKRILHGEFLRALQHTVLQNMGQARTVVRRGAESDKKYFVLIPVCHEENARAALFVLQNHSLGIHLPNIALRYQTVRGKRLYLFQLSLFRHTTLSYLMLSNKRFRPSLFTCVLLPTYCPSDGPL